MSKGKHTKENSKVKSIQHERTFILSQKTPFSTLEEYKALRTNIIFSLPDEKCKVIGMTSANSREGKSINCLNLAITFAQTNAKVLLLDCDLRLPKQSRLLEIEAVPGISNVLIGMNTLSESIRKTRFECMDVLPSGDIPPNPSELLGCEKMGRVIEELKNSYDYIFVDLPPINVVADAAVMSKYLSGIVLVVRSGSSKKEEEVRAITQLEFVHANLLGILLNFAVGNGSGEKYKGSKYGYQKYYRQYSYGYVQAAPNNKNGNGQNKDLLRN